MNRSPLPASSSSPLASRVSLLPASSLASRVSRLCALLFCLLSLSLPSYSQRIPDLPSITGANVNPAEDLLWLNDTSAGNNSGASKKITLAELVNVSSFTNGNFLSANAVEFSQVNGLQSALDGKMANTNAAVNAAVAASPRDTRNALEITKPALVAFLGDSITAQGQNLIGWYARNTSIGYANWTLFFLHGRAQALTRSELSPADHFGTSGFMTHQIRGVAFDNFTVRTEAEIAASNSLLSTLIHRAKGKDVAVVDFSGTNDILLDSITYTGAQIADKRRAIWEEMIVCGIPARNIVGVALTPFQDSVKNAMATAANAANAADAAELGVTWVPTPAAMVSAGAPNLSYFTDVIGVHPNKIGALTLGQAVATALSPIVDDRRFTLPPSGSKWLSGNPYMTGSSAVSGSGYSGNLATSWSVPFGADANTSSTLTKITDGEGEWQRVVTTGTNRDGGVILQQTFSTVPAGTRFRMVLRARGSGFHSFTMQYILNSGSTAQLNGPGGDLVSQNPLNLPAFDGLFVSPIMVMPGGFQEGPTIWVQGLGAGTLEIRQCGLLLEDNSTLIRNEALQTVSSMVLTGSPPATSCTVLCNANAIPFQVNLPAVAGVLGREYTFVKTDSSANSVTLDGSGSETVNGSATLVLTFQWGRATILAANSGWIQTK